MSESTFEAAAAPGGSTSGSSGGSTGDDRVDRVVARLGSLDGQDLSGQLATFTELQAALSAVLDGDESAVNESASDESAGDESAGDGSAGATFPS